MRLLLCIQHWELVPEHAWARSSVTERVRPGVVGHAQTQAGASSSLEQREWRPAEKLEGGVKHASAWEKGVRAHTIASRQRVLGMPAGPHTVWTRLT